METRFLPVSSPTSLQVAVELLKQKGLVAFPTDTVYGLGALAFDFKSVAQLYEVKGRETSKAIAVLIGDLDALHFVTGEMGELARRLAGAFWPGPLTLVVSASPNLPPNLSPLPTIGVRMPDHAAALELLRLAGPLAVTSANRSGMPNTLTAQQVFDQLGGSIPLILDGGRTPGGKPSTVVDCTRGEPFILRRGPISLHQLQSAVS